MKKILSLTLAIIMLVSAIPVAFAEMMPCEVCGESSGQQCENCGDWAFCTHCGHCMLCAENDKCGCSHCNVTEVGNGTQVDYNPLQDDTIGDNNGDGVPDNQEYYTVTVPALLAPGDAGDVIAQGTWNSARKLVVTADKNVTLINNLNSTDQKVLDVEFPGIELVGSNTAAVSDTKEVSVSNIEDALFGKWIGVFEYQVELVDHGDFISFSIDGIRYQAKAGMTWKNWVESEYNTGGFLLYGEHFIDDEHFFTVSNAEKNGNIAGGAGEVKDMDAIISNYAYHIVYPPM